MKSLRNSIIYSYSEFHRENTATEIWVIKIYFLYSLVYLMDEGFPTREEKAHLMHPHLVVKSLIGIFFERGCLESNILSNRAKPRLRQNVDSRSDKMLIFSLTQC